MTLSPQAAQRARWAAVHPVVRSEVSTMKKATLATIVSTGLAALAPSGWPPLPSRHRRPPRRLRATTAVDRDRGPPIRATRRHLTAGPDHRRSESLCAVWHLGTLTAEDRSGVPSDRPSTGTSFLARRNTFQRVPPAAGWDRTGALPCVKRILAYTSGCLLTRTAPMPPDGSAEPRRSHRYPKNARSIAPLSNWMMASRVMICTTRLDSITR